MKSTIYELGSEPPCLPGLFKQNHKKAPPRFSTNKSQQLWSLSLKYANYGLTFVNKMFPSILQLPVLSYTHITLKNQLRTQESGDCRPSGLRKSPSLATLVWILSRHLPAGFCATQSQPCPWALLKHSWDLPPSASVSCKGPISFAQRCVSLSWAWCQAAPGPLD